MIPITSHRLRMHASEVPSLRPHRLAGLAKHFCMMCPMVFSLVGRVMAILSRLLEGPEIRIPYATILIACAALASLWFLGRKLPEPFVVAVAAVLGILIFPLTHA